MENTKTNGTVAAYQARGLQLWKTAAFHEEVLWKSMPASLFIEWLKSHLITLRPSSKRQYLASCREFLNTRPTWIEDRPDLEKSIKHLASIHASDFVNPDCPTIKRRTSAHKAKQVKLNELITSCKRELIESTSKWTPVALLWMTVNVLLGLRPCEWRYAEIVDTDEMFALKVKNAKATNGRSHGQYRYIDIDSLGSTELKLLERLLKIIKGIDKSDHGWNSFYNSVRRRIYTLVRKVKRFQLRYPTLYSTRHQFAANAKSAGISMEAIAAMMGHATNQTVSQTYGRKKDGSNHFNVKANPSDIARVKIKIRNSRRFNM